MRVTGIHPLRARRVHGILERRMDLGKYDGRWCAIYVRPKHEFFRGKVAQEKGYEVFSPSCISSRCLSNRQGLTRLTLSTVAKQPANIYVGKTATAVEPAGVKAFLS